MSYVVILFKRHQAVKDKYLGIQMAISKYVKGSFL